jgi:hypothetical protein
LRLIVKNTKVFQKYADKYCNREEKEVTMYSHRIAYKVKTGRCWKFYNVTKVECAELSKKEIIDFLLEHMKHKCKAEDIEILCVYVDLTSNGFGP